MEANRNITYNVTKHALKRTSESSSREAVHYAKAITLIILMMLVYKICISENTRYTKPINKIVHMVVSDTGIDNRDSNKTISIKYVVPAINKSTNSIQSSDTTMIDTLNFVEEQNENMADSMVNSYFRGIAFADSTYRVKKLCSIGMFFATIVCSPLVSVFPVAVSSAVAPSIKDLHTNAANLNNRDFIRGYKYEAHYIKKRKLWASFLEGGTPWCVLAGFLGA